MIKQPILYLKSVIQYETTPQTSEDNENISRKLILRKPSAENEQPLVDRININKNLSEIINDLFEIINTHNLNINIKYNKEQFLYEDSNSNHENSNHKIESLIRILIENIDILINCPTSSSSTSVLTFLIQLLRKHFHPNQYRKYYLVLIGFLKRTRNNKIINELLNIWSNQSLVMDDEIIDTLLPCIKKNLLNSDHRIRSNCLRILAYHYSKHAKFENNKIVKVLLNYSEDQDPRIRITSLELMILLHINGLNVSVDYYDDLKNFLNDDYHQVRLLTTELICLLAFSYPEYMVSLDSNNMSPEDERIRLVDDVFSKVCCMINDISVDVKVCASNLLGKIDTVSSRFLLQTLDKKLMSDLKVRKFQKLRQKQLVSSEWTSSSANATTSSDSVISDEDNLNLMASGACGALIHGLEDEFLEVRSEAVESLCHLAYNCPKLAAKSIDFFVDMFNDEIEAVRLKAIQALTKITHYVLLSDDQVDIVISVIEDGCFEVREALRDLFSKCKLATKIGLKKVIQALFNNLRKFYIDKLSIWNCFKNLGKNHSKFVVSLVSHLVGLHPFISVTEPDINDVYYISSLILIYNGVNENSAILPLLPKYIMNHYFFLKLKLPNMIPNIQLIENYPISIDRFVANFKKDTDRRKLEEIKRFFIESKSNIKMMLKKSSNNVNLINEDDEMINLLESIGRDIFYLSEIESNLSCPCEIMKLYIDCYLIIRKKVVEKQNSVCLTTKSVDGIHKLIQIEEAISLSIKLLLLYKGFDKTETLTILQLYLYLRGLYLKELYKRKTVFNSTANFNHNSYLKANAFRQDLIKECRSYFSLLRLFDACFKNQLNANLAVILKELPYYETNQLNEIELLSKSINQNVEIDLLLLSEKRNSYVKMWLDMVEPTENIDSPLRYMPGLISNIKVKAILHNFSRFDNLFVQIIYSNNDKQLIPIDSMSIKLINTNKHSIDFNVNLSNISCTDSFYVKIGICMLVDEYNDVKDTILQTSTRENEKEIETVINSMGQLRNITNSIELSQNVKIYFEPLLTKKFF